MRTIGYHSTRTSSPKGCSMGNRGRRTERTTPPDSQRQTPCTPKGRSGGRMRKHCHLYTYPFLAGAYATAPLRGAAEADRKPRES